MANPTWFDSAFYMGEKLKQMQLAEPDAGWDAEKLQAAFDANGFGGEEGAFNHYMQYGESENVNPNAYFDIDVYMTGKLEQMRKTDPDYTMDELKQAFKDAGLSAIQHYEQYGAAEGVNPSNQFDQNKYMDAKLKQMQATDPSYTMEQLQQAFKDAGLSPLDHYLQYGKNEGVAPEATDHPITPERPANPGETFTLTTGKDVIAGTPKDDTINGATSLSSKDATLNPEDQIDGGEGYDTLAIDMKGNFGGFDDGGFLKGVEKVDLTNADKTARTFNAKGAEGVESFNLKGNVNLAALADTKAAVNLSERAEGKAVIGFTDGATAGAEDALSLGVENVGTAASADGKTKVAAVTIEAKGIETMNVTAEGKNFVAFGDGVTSITAGGKGDLTITTTGKDVKEVNASAMTGNFDVSLSNAKGLTTLHGGAGDDIFRAGSGVLTPDATINGGAGEDTLQLSGNIGATRLTLNEVETVSLAGATGSFDGVNFNGVSTIAVAGAGNDGTFVNMGANDMAFSLNGASGKASSDHQGATVVDTTGSGNSVTLIADKSTAVTFNVDEDGFTLASGSTFGSAESLTVNTDGKFDGASGAFAKVSSVDVSGFGSATLGNFSVGDQDFTLVGNGLSASGGLEVGTIKVGNGHTITADVSGVMGTIKLGAMDATDGNIAINAGGAMGDVTATGANKAHTVDFTGSSLNANKATFTLTGDVKEGGTANLTGGMVDDTFTITGSAGADTITITDTMGSGTGTIKTGGGADHITLGTSDSKDTITFDGVAIDSAFNATVTVDNFNGGEANASFDQIKLDSKFISGVSAGEFSASASTISIAEAASGKAIFVSNGTFNDAADIAKLFSETVGASQKNVLVTQDSDGNYDIWYVNAGFDGSAGTKVDAAKDIKLIGTLDHFTGTIDAKDFSIV